MLLLWAVTLLHFIDIYLFGNVTSPLSHRVKGVKMNTHKILSNNGYSLLDNYPEIARYAANLNVANKEELLNEVKAAYGVPNFDLPHEQAISYNVWGKDIVPDNALEQMDTVMRMPRVVGGALMPDAHKGYAMPIGGVAVLDNAISPSFVGYDIACRMTMSILDINPTTFMQHRDDIATIMQSVSAFGMGASFEGENKRDHSVMDNPLWDELAHVKQLKDLAWQQLGSSGGGNHFFDAMLGEVVQEVDWLPFPEGYKFVAIVTHSGSRGVGHKLATYYVKQAEKYTSRIAKNIPKGYEWLDLDTEMGQEYVAVMNLMGDYAQANHHLIHSHFSKESDIGILLQFENHHNFAWVEEGTKIIHRKGATPAGLNVPGIIPGTSGTPSYLVKGLGNSASFSSSSHGAGRPFSRTEAYRRHDQNKVNEKMGDDILTFGLNPDETFLAYKDIDEVMLAQQDLVTPVAKLLPKIVIMGGKSDDGD